MSEEEAERLLAGKGNTGRLCVRYLYDATSGEIAFNDVEPALVPVTRLRLKTRLAKMAAVAAPVLLEACGGVGAYDVPSRHDPFVPAVPSVVTEDGDGGVDAGQDAADAADAAGD